MKTKSVALFATLFPVFTLSAQNDVNMTPNLTFDPANITINAGETVTWHNTSQVEHSSTSGINCTPNTTGLIWDKHVQPGNSASQTFSTAGTYDYYCFYHCASGGFQMKGTVTVQTTTGINEMKKAGRFNLKTTPNPVTDEAILEFTCEAGKSYMLEISDLNGKNVPVSESGVTENGINTASLKVASLNPGVYIVKLLLDDELIIEKFIKK
jgi:plastocyanin